MSERTPTYTAADYSSSQVRLYGLPVEPAKDGLNLGGLLVKGGGKATYFRTADPAKEMLPAIIFGYAYQGHCYDLPKPKGMLLPGKGLPIPAEDCGYAGKPGYRVWVVPQREYCLEIEITEGRLEELVLEANTPGRRSPTTYRSAMQLAHRSGRLTD